MSELPADLQARVRDAWHEEAAGNSLERWLAVRAQERWSEVPADMDALISVFGASWYLTRFVFYRGLDAARILDQTGTPDFSPQTLEDTVERGLGSPGAWQLEQLCCVRNEILLRIVCGWLRGAIDQEHAEQALSTVAVVVIRRLLELAGLQAPQFRVPLAVLGMGRLAGREMNFGSDLDLIFLHAASDQDEAAEVTRRVRRFLRSIATLTAAGALYEVDMRLRPHGTAGALITSVDSFRDYHHGEREIWERQLMTRCRAVVDPDGIGAAALVAVQPDLYAVYEDRDLQHEIGRMRARVEQELGRPRGRFEIKRGRGGLMDFDFISHYLQLRHGRQQRALQDSSTRGVLRTAGRLGLLARSAADRLLRNYEFLKRVEAGLRLFDMKNVSAFDSRPGANPALAKAMAGWIGAAPSFEERYAQVTEETRALFETVIPWPEPAPS